MFDIGGPELLLILLAVIVLFGPKKIPEMAQMIGKGLNKVKQVQSQFHSQIEEIKTEVQHAGEPKKQDSPPLEQDKKNDLKTFTLDSNKGNELNNSNEKEINPSLDPPEYGIEEMKEDTNQDEKDEVKPDVLEEFRYPEDYNATSRSGFSVKPPKLSIDMLEDSKTNNQGLLNNTGNLENER